MYRSKGSEKSGRAKTGVQHYNYSLFFKGLLLLFSPNPWLLLPQLLRDRQGYTSKGPNKPVIVVGKAQELLKFLDNCRSRKVLHRLYFLFIHLQFSRARNMSKKLYLKLAKNLLFHFGIQLLLSKPLQCIIYMLLA